MLPARRGLHDAVAPKTAKMREQMVRLHLTPYLQATDIRVIDSATVDALEAHFIRTGRPPSRRSIQIALGTLRQVLTDAVVKRIVETNAVDVWKTALRSKGRKRAGTGSKKIAEWKVLDSEEREQLLAAFEQDASHHFPLVLWLVETLHLRPMASAPPGRLRGRRSPDWVSSPRRCGRRSARQCRTRSTVRGRFPPPSS